MRNLHLWVLAAAIVLGSCLVYRQAPGEHVKPVGPSRSNHSAGRDVHTSAIDQAGRVVNFSQVLRAVNGDIRGRLIDEATMQPIGGGKVDLLGDERIDRSVYTVANGEFFFETPPEAVSSIIFRAPGYETQEMLMADFIEGASDVKMVARHHIEIVVTWEDGTGVQGADIMLIGRTLPRKSRDWESAHKSLLLAKTDSDGRASIRVSGPCFLEIQPIKGSCKVVLAKPGQTCLVGLTKFGTALRIWADGLDLAAAKSGYSLNKVDGGFDQYPLRIQNFNRELLLSPGVWLLKREVGPVLIAKVEIDGIQLQVDKSSSVEVMVEPSSSVVDVYLEADWRIELVDGQSGEGVPGAFVYKYRHLNDAGKWIDGAEYNSIASSAGVAAMQNIRSRDILERNCGLRVEVPGYASEVIDAESVSAGILEKRMIQVRLRALVPTLFEMAYADGRIFQGNVMISAGAHGPDREVFVGSTDLDGSLPPLYIEPSESLFILDWGWSPLGFMDSDQIKIGGTNALLVDSLHGSLRIKNAPLDGGAVEVQSIRGDVSGLLQVGSDRKSGPLRPGRYFVGPKKACELCTR